MVPCCSYLRWRPRAREQQARPRARPPAAIWCELTTVLGLGALLHWLEAKGTSPPRLHPIPLTSTLLTDQAKMSFAASALRRAASEVAPKVAAAGQRGIASSRSAAGGAHDPHYVHAETMYELWNMKNRKAKFGSAIVGVVVGGFAVPLIACWYSQYKTRA